MVTSNIRNIRTVEIYADPYITGDIALPLMIQHCKENQETIDSP